MTGRNTRQTKLFEFFRVLDSSLTAAKGEGYGVLFCNPRHQRATYNNLSEVCAKEYGAGHFVAIEIGEDKKGLPLSYWVIKVKSIKRIAHKEVFMDDDELKNFRVTRYLIPTEEEGIMTLDEGRPYFSSGFGDNDSWQRGAEASWAAFQLKSLPDPEIPSYRKESPQTKVIRELLEAMPRPSDNAIIDELVRMRAELWPGKSEELSRENAERSLQSFKRIRRMKRQKARRIPKGKIISKKRSAKYPKKIRPKSS